ncbi:hypothetical protein [Pseudalkalibacillus sp. NRS-1564]|uniref:hypothetical protein n=1 Tax=Pseudalkalibacillus sp. NRS-1564 TaxID=3233900 RepID=UPI003D2ADA14
MNKKKKSVAVGIVVLIGILLSVYEYYQPDVFDQATQVAYEEFEADFKDRYGKDPEGITVTSAVESSNSWMIAFATEDRSPETERIAEYEVTEDLSIQNSSWYVADQIKAYKNLVSAHNKGNKEAYLQSYSHILSSHSLQKLEEKFNMDRNEEHLLFSEVTLIDSYEKTAILLSEESHAFNQEFKYSLDSFVILNKENGQWKVLEKLPFKKTGRRDYDTSSDFDKTEEVIKKIKQNYDIAVERYEWALVQS